MRKRRNVFVAPRDFEVCARILFSELSEEEAEIRVLLRFDGSFLAKLKK
jgi:hypothetical protein